MYPYSHPRALQYRQQLVQAGNSCGQLWFYNCVRGEKGDHGGVLPNIHSPWIRQTLSTTLLNQT